MRRRWGIRADGTAGGWRRWRPGDGRPLGAALLLLAACSSLGVEAAIQGKRPFDPPPIYVDWWAATEACSGREGDFEAIDWFLAIGIDADGVVARARWSPPHEIILVEGHEDDEKTVRHEMLHDLLSGDGNHESEAWVACDLLFGG